MSPKEQSNGGQQTKSGGEAPAGDDRAATIARIAFEKWQARGCPDGDDRRDWFEAEQEVRAAAGPQPRVTAPSSSQNRA